jgi:aspartyl-tRNA(Asn)/glutamyl-tRNA(Gln) amidotransferase subunit B
MEEGSLRCDANVSIRLKGETTLGTKVEVKNLNSIRNVKKAIEFEIERMIELVEKGEKITQQTRSFDAETDTTFAIRDKEEANDYRYFPEPDLTPFLLTDEFISGIKSSLPALPEELYLKYLSLGLSEYDARQLCDDKNTANYFDETCQYLQNYKAIVNWITGPLRQHANEKNISVNEVGLRAETLAQLIQMVDDNRVNFSVASTKILQALIDNQDKTAMQVATELNLLQVSNTNDVEAWINEVLNKMPEKVVEFKKGKKGLLGLFVGEVKKVSKGKADPKIATQLLEEKLKQ